MKIINVKGEHRYPVKIGVNWASQVKTILNIHSKTLIVAPKSVVSRYKLKESSSMKLLITPEGENQKTLNTLNRSPTISISVILITSFFGSFA